MMSKKKNVLSILILFSGLMAVLLFGIPTMDVYAQGFEDAENISLGDTKTGTAYGSYPQDKDPCYKYVSSYRHTIKIKLVTYNTSYDNIYMYIFDSDGNQLQYEVTSKGNKLGKVTDEYYYTLDPGLYYIILDYHYFTMAGMKYDINISNYSTSILYNYSGQSIQNAKKIELGQKIRSFTRGTYADNHIHWYKISLPSDTTVLINTKLYDGFAESLHIGVMDSERIIKEYFTDYQYADYQYSLFLNKGEYYITVEYGYGTFGGKFYDLTINQKQTLKKPLLAFSSSSVKKVYGDSPFINNLTKLTDGTLDYMSSNYEVASVNENGRVTVKGVGIAEITVVSSETSNYKAGSSGFIINVKPKGTSIATLNAGSRSIKVVLKKQLIQTTGYQVQISMDSSFSHPTTKTLRNNMTSSVKYTNLKARRKYYVRVRTYKQVSGKNYYSSWSTPKAVTTK